MSYRQLVENGEPIELELNDEQVDGIRASSREWKNTLRIRDDPISIEKIGPGTYSVRSKGVAGFVRAGSITFEIAPKFLNQATMGSAWKRALWRLLAYGYGVDLVNTATTTQLVESDGIADVLADLFMSSLAGAAVRGFPLGYVQQGESSEFLRGRLDQRRLSSLLPFTGHVPIITSRLTKDVAINRLLKWAALELARLVENSQRRKRLETWTLLLEGVKPSPPRLDQISTPKRQHAYLAPAVQLGQMLLEDRGISFGKGALHSPGFLWDSEDLFERVVLRLFDSAARPLGMTATKRRTSLASYEWRGTTRHVATTPDVDIHESGVSRTLADAKYKTLGMEPDNNDMYQVLAGGRAADTKVVALVYPGTGKQLTTREFVPEGGGRPDRVDTLSLGLEAFASAADVRKLQKEVTDWLERSQSFAGSVSPSRSK